MVERLKAEVCEANLALVRHGLVILTWGNVSAIDRQSGLVVIKPSGVPYDEMTPNDMVVTDLDGRTVAGRLRPSSDLPTHLVLYRAWESVGAIVHTHSEAATIFAQACREIPCFGTTHADAFHGAVPLTRALNADETAAKYEVATGEVIVERFAHLDPLHVPATLVSHHAPFAWGATTTQAVENAVTLEAVARMALGTLQLHRDQSAIPTHISEKHFTRKHGANAYYGQKN